MNKAQYLLMAAFVGFYGLLSAFLLVRAFAVTLAARMKRMRPVVATASKQVKTARRAWTAAVVRKNFTPRAIGAAQRGARALG